MPDPIAEHTRRLNECLSADDELEKEKLGLGILLRQAYMALRHTVNVRLAKSGCNIDQLVLINMLAERGDVTQKYLVENAGYDASTISQMFRVLERKGIITRKPHPTDGRSWQVRLTPKGQRLQRKLWSETADLRDTLWNAIPARERKTVASNLVRINRALLAARGSKRS